MSSTPKNITLNSRNYKTFKILYKHSLFKNYLLNNTVLFFYYDIFTSENEFNIKKITQKYDLTLIKIKKNLMLNNFSNIKYSQIKNILTNNSLIITSNDKKIFLQKNFLNSILEIKNINCIGI